ncbi:glycerate kinase [Aplysia californica]|uniref:Glycerate kinase n=1 Tax=Aplysia californica TaxID=6500 RepID=A0ABM0JEN2_APLCA|nr:glycerate kinase [Aplysia californica]XP_005092003.1 glycerate kinase [Aplysia californica]
MMMSFKNLTPCLCREFTALRRHPCVMFRMYSSFRNKRSIVNFIDKAVSLRGYRQLSFSTVRNYEAVKLEEDSGSINLKSDATEIFKSGIKAVHPKQMIWNVLKYQPGSSVLHVKDQTFRLKRNVFVVGMGSSVLGMARAVENMLGEHIVSGVVSVPSGLQEEMRKTGDSEMMLRANSKITVFEGAENNEVDEAALNASKAILSLVTRLSEKDLLIVLCSGGGSALCPLPKPPMTLQDLHTVSRLLNQEGASMQELNTVLKNLEILKGGGLAMAAQPAKVVTLILSSMVGDPIDLIASGPTCLAEPTPIHSLQIIQRLGLIPQVPESVKKYLEREAKQQQIDQAQEIHGPRFRSAEEEALCSNVQNIIVGNNSLACEEAARKASEMGYLPLILSKILTGEAQEVGALCATLVKFIMICFDRKASLEPNSELAMLELKLVAGGIDKKSVNDIVSQVDRGSNFSKDICIIVGGDTTVDVKGSGVGGKNLETALAAAVQMHEDFRRDKLSVTETNMCVLCCDSNGYDGLTQVAGAVVDLDFLDHVKEDEYDMQEYLANNDTFSFFSKINEGRNLVRTNKTGTNVMDMMILLVRRSRE